LDQSLLLSIFTFLAAASLIVPLSKLTGLGPVIGYLVAGVLIGPSVSGFISEPETILHFSEFGVVLMLFLIGLELQPRQLWALRIKLIGLGGLQVGFTLALLALALIGLGFALPTAIVIGMGLALSSTAVALQLMQDRGILATTAGQSGFSVLLFQDVIVIAMIAGLPLLAAFSGSSIDHSQLLDQVAASHPAETLGPTGLWRGVAIIAVFATIIGLGRFVLHPLFNLIARSGVRETFTAVALSLVVGAALLMRWLDLSAALGAFLAGVVLADSDYRHQLERDIEPFKALLLGLFFISVGMSLEFDIIMQSPGLILGGVLGLILIKILVLLGVGYVFNLAFSANILFTVLLCQAGEFGFVLFQFASTEGLMSASLVSQASAIIALSMALTPIMLIVVDKFVCPLFASSGTSGEAPENENSRVLVLGFGRVGQLAARLLHTQDIDTTLLDHDSDHIEFVKQFGNRVFYGDAGDVDLLRIAGADTADLIIIAIDDANKATRIAGDIKQFFPKAKVIARARNRNHMFDLMAENVDFVERETVRGALALGRSALELLGLSPEYAQQLSDDFLKYDHQLIEESWEHRDDIDVLIKKAESGREFIKRTLNADKERNINTQNPSTEIQAGSQ